MRILFILSLFLFFGCKTKGEEAFESFKKEVTETGFTTVESVSDLPLQAPSDSMSYYAPSQKRIFHMYFYWYKGRRFTVYVEPNE